MSDRKKLIEKIKALLSKTVENGCTEAEAFAAISKAQEMMASYDVSEADLAFGGEGVAANGRYKPDHLDLRSQIAIGIAAFCDCKVWRSGPEQIVFCGLESDTVFAHWLLDVLDAFGRRSLLGYLAETKKVGSPRIRRIEEKAFLLAFANRINARLREMAHKNRGVGNGRSLVVAKNALIDAYIAEQGLKFKHNSSRSVRVDRTAFDAGKAAGDRAQFNRPVNEGRGVQRLR